MERRFINGRRMLFSLLLLIGQLVSAAGEPRDLDASTTQRLLNASPVSVFIFLSVECPISNKYIPEIGRLASRFGTNVQFVAIYPNADETADQVARHRSEYKIAVPEWRDPKHLLVEFSGVKLTPEAVVVKEGSVLYRGRIDDRYVDLGQSRPEAHEHDLETAIRGILNGTILKLVSKSAVGCAISNLPPP